MSGNGFQNRSWDPHHIPLSRESSRDDLVSISQDQIFEYEERFRVDRRKLELMILQKLEHIEVPAADFFNRIEYETNTTIIWPSRLKIGAKSKKDPHIRVGGCEKFVKEAKCLIMEFLDNKTNRVTMKMDVSYTDHSHVIGKGGNTIRRVMAETNCHIHFPDSNRSNPNEKSNQVSIAGEVEGVERARARVRELTPLVFNFDLPVIPSLQSTPDPLDPYLRAIQDQYNIQKQKNFHTTTVVVKGCEWEGSRVKEATLLLIDHLCQTSLNVPVAMNMEISPQHHSIVLGKGNMTLKVIMQRTNTTILFPDAGDPNIPPIRKGSVTITGAIHNVYLARQQLMGSLPLVMMFDLPESLSIDDSFIRKLQEENDVNISIKPKARQNNKAVIIKAQERNASGIYKSRIDLLNLHDLEAIVAVIPETYKIPCVLGKLDCVDPISLPINHRSSLMIFPKPLREADLNGINDHTMVNLPNLSKTPVEGLVTENSSYNSFNHKNLCYSSTKSCLQISPSSAGSQNFINGMTPNHPYLQEYAMLVLSNISRLQQKQNVQLKEDQKVMDPWISQRMKNESLELNGFNADMCSSVSDSPPLDSSSPRDDPSSMDFAGSIMKSMSKVDFNQNCHKISDTPYSTMGIVEKCNGSNLIEFADVMNELASTNDRRAPGCEIKSKLNSKVQVTEKDCLSKCGVSAWPTGLGFTSFMNETMEILDKSMESSPTVVTVPKASSCIMLDNSVEISSSSSNFDSEEYKFGCQGSSWDKIQFSDGSLELSTDQILSADNLASVLTSEGLNKYVDLFLRHEIDLQTFTTLTENDLKEIGVCTFGARKKILLVSMKLKKNLSGENWL
ncbi:protein bicaudal C homolog 1 isoform X2 [Lepeophtheirus salmonis]|uniref:protein bicaudal C homolog 1 isoform X2 n=1 Tax=Lepeophtheirus salmonis TaxID=72036 RepID=UPI001AE7C10D|nr:protein bicaudal C homolog 1-like isoform X2 [Lepeophtheirus salmonis]